MILVKAKQLARRSPIGALAPLLLFLVALSGTPVAASAPDARSAVTQHEISIRGKSVPYVAKVAEFFVNDESGKPAASVVTIAYLRSDVPDPAKRPVMFLFNGGPGASSSPLHMNAMGPVVRIDMRPGTRDQSGYANNADSALDVVDLVFIDPVSTGFSRPLPGMDPQSFYDSIGDAKEVADVIVQWLKANRREASPRFLAGESYGTTRAPLIVKHRPDLRWQGVLLVSGGGDPEGPGMEEANRIPTMAAAAWYHNVIDRRGRSVEAFYAEASSFARGEYLRAINQAGSLSDRERRRVAAKLAAYIGLPADELVADDLRVKDDFTMRLLKPKNLRIGRLDTRVTGPLPKQAATTAIDDPSLGVVKAGAEANATPASIGAVPSPVVGRYIVEQLKFPTSETYIGVNFLANSKWTHLPRNRQSSAAVIAEAMRADPKLRLYFVSGLYDLYATDGAGFVQAGVPAARLTTVQLAGPHQVYDGENARSAFNQSIRDFVTNAR